MSQPFRIPLNAPSFDDAEIMAVESCLKSGIVSSASPEVAAFEKEFAYSHKIPYAIATQSGTSALHLALLALGIGPGDEVIVPALSFVATVNPVKYVGATPVFVDIEIDTLALDPIAVEEAITKKTKAIVISHLYGLPSRSIKTLRTIAKRDNIPLIEDAAEALGAYVNKYGYVGTLGAIGCFSFNGNKTITTGGGGMAVTRDAELAQKMRHLSTQAKTENFSHDAIGYNYRMTGIQAAIGWHQLHKLPTLIEKKKEIHERYYEGFCQLPWVEMLSVPSGMTGSYWLSAIRIDRPALDHLEDHGKLDSYPLKLIREAAKEGIEMRPFFTPFEMMPMYASDDLHNRPNTMQAYMQGVCLPSSPSMTQEEQKEVIEVVKSVLLQF